MKHSIKAAALVIAALICVSFSGCFNPHEGKVNDYIKENSAFSTQISHLKAIYGDTVDVKTFGRGSDLVIEITVKASLPDNGEGDYSAVEEMLKPYLPEDRDEDPVLLYGVRYEGGYAGLQRPERVQALKERAIQML